MTSPSQDTRVSLILTDDAHLISFSSATTVPGNTWSSFLTTPAGITTVFGTGAPTAPNRARKRLSSPVVQPRRRAESSAYSPRMSCGAIMAAATPPSLKPLVCSAFSPIFIVSPRTRSRCDMVEDHVERPSIGTTSSGSADDVGLRNSSETLQRLRPGASKVLHCWTDPESMPVVNQRTRCWRIRESTSRRPATRPSPPCGTGCTGRRRHASRPRWRRGSDRS